MTLKDTAAPRARARMNVVDSTLSRALGDPEPGPLQDPLETLVLTILSQNTNDTNRDRAWDSMWKRFRNWSQIESAPVSEIEKAIRVGGLAASKAAHIKAALARVRERFGSHDLSGLRKVSPGDARSFLEGMKGVGPKTLSIVLLFSLGIEAFPLDTHCLRILKRLTIIPEQADAREAHEIAVLLVKPGRSMPLHLNLIRFGRQRCHARNPQCKGCPLRMTCSYSPES